jgi:tetratricopeptide (TPR) repeat protein
MWRAFLFCWSGLALTAPAQTFLVTPFVNQTGDAKLDWMGESAASMLTDALAREDLLTVNRTAREEVYRRLALKRQAPLTTASILKAAMAADASFVIAGRVEAAGSGWRLTASMYDVKRLAAGPEFTTAGERDGFSVLVHHLAWQALQFALPDQAPGKEDYLRRNPPVRLEALEQHARGLVAVSDEQRISYWTQAARADSRFASPALELGRLYIRKKQWQEAALWLARVDTASPGIREAFFWLGVARYELGDFEAAAQAFQEVARAVPLSEVWNNLGAAEARRGRVKEAQAAYLEAIQGDTADPAYRFNLGLLLLRAGRRDEAAARFREVLDRDSTDAAATELLGRAIAPPTAAALPGRAEERLKFNYEETAWLQLKALLGRRPD